MAETFTVTTERVDDIPLLLAQISKMGIPELMDRFFVPHGNWSGTSLGWTTSIWLAHILSRGDHRLSWVQRWVAERIESLQINTGQAIRPLEWSDDRLGIVLDGLGQPEPWQAFEAALNRRTIRVYDLQAERVRVDSTTASGYWTVTEAGLFQFGHSKDHRPDLPQLKVMLSVLDPLGMPVATQVVSGERADDPLYVPAIHQVHAGLRRSGLLYVGDCKLGALATRAWLCAQQDYYLCPLAERQLPVETLECYLQPVWAEKLKPRPIYRQNTTGQLEQIAVGFEREAEMTYEGEGRLITWSERHLIVRSLQQVETLEKGLRTRLAKAQAQLEQLNERRQGKKRLTSRDELEQAAREILQRHRVEGLLKVVVTEQVKERQLRVYRERPATVRLERFLSLQVEVDQLRVTETIRRFGWRVYATNQSAGLLPLEKAVLAYRAEYLVERGFGRLKGRPLSLTPMYLQSDQRATGLVCLLSLGLRVLTLTEFQVRRRLAEQKETLAGLYAGNPKRSTSRPTAEALLESFKNITLSVVTLDQQTLRHLNPLSELQKRILELLDFSTDIYDRLTVISSQPP
jgi:transposase